MNWLDSILNQSGTILESLLDRLVSIGLVLVSSSFALGILAVLVYGAWVAISAGLRREERARCFIRLLELGLKQGRSIEETIQSLADARIRDLGVQFHLLAAWMERGQRLSAALEEVPRFIPPQVASMLRVGEEIGNITAVLPACRESLTAGTSDSRKRTNNMFVLFLISPLAAALLWVMAISIMPKFRELARDMGVSGDSFEALFQLSFVLGTVSAVLWILLWLMEAGRSGGQWLLRSVLPPSNRALDALNLLIPWKRRRLQRDFSAMLAVTLDAGIPEERAIRLAANATSNVLIQSRAEAAVVHLKEGKSLADALQPMEGTGEFRWRLRNAGHSGQRFTAALRGWLESLEARAFQQEQFYSQFISTGFVLLNGLTVGLATVGIFQFLLALVEVASW